MNTNRKQHDLVIIGGGLAGLTLALQLRREQPDLDVAVLERRRHPVPLAAHKVGESTVELGAHYLAEKVGLRDHLEGEQLRKFGLRFYFGGSAGGIEATDELGVSRVLETPSYQVDRGLLENELGRRAREAGVTLVDGARAQRLSMNGTQRVSFVSDEGEGTLEARWLVDAASRASPLKRHLSLARANGHDVNAAWFRVGEEVRIDHWSSDPDWRGRTGDTPRWLSTNHLMGPGYWVWLIPLASGATSVGIVADPRFHPLEEFNQLERARRWLERHEPACAAAIEGLPVLDFGFLRHFSHDCERLFSPDRWALTGEAGVFLDPFYSPGTDFISISNSFVTELVGRERRGEDITFRSRALESVYRSFYANTLSLYEGLYPAFGDGRLMVLKTTWDYCYYWGILAKLFFNDAMSQLVDDAALRDILLRSVGLNQALQARFAEAGRNARSYRAEGRFFDQFRAPLMRRWNAELNERCDGERLRAALADNVRELERLKDCIERRLDEPGSPVEALERELLGDFPEQLRVH